MFDGSVNKKSGVVAIQLPSISPIYWTAAHEVEKEILYPECASWISIKERAEYERRYPFLPDRIIDNLLEPKAKVSVTTWERVAGNLDNLVTLINAAYDDREGCQYDLSRPMRKANGPSAV